MEDSTWIWPSRNPGERYAPAACDSDVRALLYFTRVYIDELCVSYDRFGGFISLGDGDERFVALP